MQVRRVADDLLQAMVTDLLSRVRQLEERVRQLEGSARGPQVPAAVAPAPVAPAPPATPPRAQKAAPAPPPETPLEAHRVAEKAKILKALEAHNWNRVEVADALGIPRRTLYRRLKEYGIQ